MAEQERKTKAERREEKRQRRLEEEKAAEAASRRQTIRNGGIAVALVLVLGALGYLAFENVQGSDIESEITVTAAEVEEARAAAGCEVLEITPIESRDHLDPATAPPEDVLYTQGRPTATGPHYANPGPVFGGVRDQQLDERSTTHNMEHGSVIVWYDPEQVSDEDVDEMDEMVESLNEAGFASNNGRAGIFASPYTDPGIDSGKAIAIRSWAQGMDCEEWDIAYAYGWIAQNFGSRGPAPESPLGQYPEGVLDIAGEEGDDADPEDSATEGTDAEGEPSDGTTEGATEQESPAEE